MVATLAVATVRLTLIVVLPFAVLVRGATWLYQHQEWAAWPALGGAAGAALIVLTAYGGLLARRLTGRARWGAVAKWIAAPLIVGYCGIGLLYLSRVNAKTDDVRAAYTETHPLLRVALATLILADRNAVVTDLARQPGDYAAMALPLNPQSLHLTQPDGWVHAIDLRTAGQPLMSWIAERYFRLMGFRTLRHIGTADHLHVELPPRPL